MVSMSIQNQKEGFLSVGVENSIKERGTTFVLRKTGKHV
jgi:hypothetical protein